MCIYYQKVLSRLLDDQSVVCRIWIKIWTKLLIQIGMELDPNKFHLRKQSNYSKLHVYAYAYFRHETHAPNWCNRTEDCRGFLILRVRLARNNGNFPCTHCSLHGSISIWRSYFSKCLRSLDNTIVRNYRFTPSKIIVICNWVVRFRHLWDAAVLMVILMVKK